MLKIWKSDLELLTEREHLDMVENRIRGGVSSVFAKRLCKANNKFMPDYKQKQQSTFILIIDANNLYGETMEKFPLPISTFEKFEKSEWTYEIEREVLQRILNTPDDNDVGFFVEVDLIYPDELHDLHSYFSLAPRKESIDALWLSHYQDGSLDQMNVRAPPAGKKLIQAFFPKLNYTLHYQTLKQYVQLGLKVAKLHHVLGFKQGKRLTPYVQLNTQKRKEAKTKFERISTS